MPFYIRNAATGQIFLGCNDETGRPEWGPAEKAQLYQREDSAAKVAAQIVQVYSLACDVHHGPPFPNSPIDPHPPSHSERTASSPKDPTSRTDRDLLDSDIPD
jgi:hypothetical protein